MDRFRGSLASYGLSLLMPAFVDGSAVEGTLQVERGAVRRRFLLRDGHLVGVSSTEPREHLGEVLARLRILEGARAAMAFEAAETARVPFGSHLLEQGLVEHPRLLEAMEYKAREALFDCYGWESGEVEFIPGPPGATQGVEPPRLGLRELHRDAMARQREWAVFWSLFAGPGTTFEVNRDGAREKPSAEEEPLLRLAERGGTLGALLASAPEGTVHGARRVLRLYRRGALRPRQKPGPGREQTPGLAELLAQARQRVETGYYEDAVALAAQALERAPVPEAHALYREAEVRLKVSLAEKVLALDGRLMVAPLPRGATPPGITVGDLYVYLKLRGGRSVREVLRHAAMGELAAYRALKRLMSAQLVRLRPVLDSLARPRADAKTHPYGVPVVLR